MTPTTPNSSLGTRFVNAYNLLDHSLRAQYNFKTNISFTDLIRRCSSLNQVIRVYEDDLIDIARLRNAIVHNSGNFLIAEPHFEIVELIERISNVIATPPLAMEVLKGTAVETIPANMCVRDFIILSYRVGHSNIPVMGKGALVGVLRRENVMHALGLVTDRGQSIDEYIKGTSIEQYLKQFPNFDHFTIVSDKITIEEVLALFDDNRKLASIIVTENGTVSGQLCGIITTADVIDFKITIERK